MAYQATLPPNNGSAPELQFRKVRKESMRDTIALGVLNILEFGLLKGSGKSNASRSSADRMLGWGVEEKGMLLNMEVETLLAWQEQKEVEVQVRSICHSRGVTADYLKHYERFNMKQCILILGDLGKGKAPWSELVQSAVYLHRKEFNILWIDVPEFASNPALWLKYGSTLIVGLLRFLCIKKVGCVCFGIGGAVFMEALTKAPRLFSRTHLIYNMDMPKGKGVHLPIFELEEALRNNELQLWFAFKDEEGVYDRQVDGTPQKAYDAIQKLQARLIGERQRNKTVKTFDEVLITENLNKNPRNQHSDTCFISVYPILVFSQEFLESASYFLQVAPGTHQDSMVGGLVGDHREAETAKLLEGAEDAAKGGNEPMAIRKARIGHLHGMFDRTERSAGNKKRLMIMEKAADEMQLTIQDMQNGSFPGFPDELRKRLGDGSHSSRSGSQASSRTGSRALSRADTGSGAGSRGGSRAVSHSRKSTLTPLGSRKPTLTPLGSRLPSHSRTSTKDELTSPALPALLASSSSMPNLPALADEPANSDSDEEEGLLFADCPEGQEPWMHYRRMWQDMHKKTPGYTAPMKKL